SGSARAGEAARGDVAVEVLNLAEAAVEICDGRPLDAYGAATQEAVARIAGAAAVLIGAPVYRASFPGVLKNLLDITPVEALQNKPVGIVAMGGSPHHYLAVDSQLRAVLAWFGALIAPTSVYLPVGDFRVKPGRGDEFVELFNKFDYGDNNPFHRSRAQVKDGVLCRDAADPDHFYLIGEWRDIEEHRRIREQVAREIRPEFVQLIE